MSQVNKRTASHIGTLIKDSPELFSIPKLGEVVQAKLLEKEPRAVYFDLGQFGTGIVFGLEFVNAREVLRNLKIGDLVSAKIAEIENDDGFLELSLTEANLQKAWQEIKELQEKDEAFNVKVTGANSGGLIANLNNAKAFIPVSQLSNEHYPRVEGNRSMIADELKKLIGEDIKVKIIDLNPRNNKLILSEKAATEQSVKELLDKYTVDQMIDGSISGVADFGAFIRFTDNPAIEGLIHISELTHKLVESPKEVVKVGDAVKAKILEIKDGRVSLSLKALLPDPWLGVEEKYKSGGKISGEISKFTPFGAFVTLDDDIQGIVHVTDFGGVEEMKTQLELGKEFPFVIESVKPAEKRISLKLAK